MEQKSSIIAIGLSVHHTPVDIREKLSIPQVGHQSRAQPSDMSRWRDTLTFLIMRLKAMARYHLSVLKAGGVCWHVGGDLLLGDALQSEACTCDGS